LVLERRGASGRANQREAIVRCFFVSDLHGKTDRYRSLFGLIERERPRAVFLGGDLLPMPFDDAWRRELDSDDFFEGFLAPEFARLSGDMGSDYPRVFVILGNDDPRAEEAAVKRIADLGLWEYVHNRRVDFEGTPVYGYAYVPPTPFQLKDWERYDVSRYVDVGCVSPEEGRRSVPVSQRTTRHATIEKDLKRLTGDEDLGKAVFLFHSPPYRTKLDRAALDKKMVDHAPMDVHVGSIAIRRMIERRRPLVTLHGHIHESASLTGSWKDRIGRTHLFSAAHNGPELALVRYDIDDPGKATRVLL
jgi:Icc-related predicted phosphoesterase